MESTLGQSVIVLGSTGSIGCNALEIAQAFQLPIEMLVAGKNIALLNQQISRFRPQFIVIADKNDANLLHPQGAKVFYGKEGILEALSLCHSPLVLNALVGFLGLEPTMTAIALGKQVALANKETLVTAGWLIDESKIIPVDSEHFSLWYLSANKAFKKLLITASGGAFRDTPLELITSQNVKEALKHPNWQMGKKITIDSASLVNKLFELLEAYWLFKTQKVDALIERKSIIHAIVTYQDGSLGMHLAKPDMKLAISYALNPHLASQTSLIPPVKFEEFASLQLEKIDCERYPLWTLKDQILKHPQLGVVLNASNEIAVEGFLHNRYSFGVMRDFIFQALDHFHSLPSLKTLQEIKALDQEVRDFTQSLLPSFSF